VPDEKIEARLDLKLSDKGFRHVYFEPEIDFDEWAISRGKCIPGYRPGAINQSVILPWITSIYKLIGTH
jgi:hypothetical protein